LALILSYEGSPFKAFGGDDGKGVKVAPDNDGKGDGGHIAGDVLKINH
jgi:hypothetical protein